MFPASHRPFGPVLGEDLHVFVVRADPTPENAAFHALPECAITASHAHRPVASGLLQVQRWMTRILFQQFVVLTRKLLDVRGQLAEAIPEIRLVKCFKSRDSFPRGDPQPTSRTAYRASRTPHPVRFPGPTRRRRARQTTPAVPSALSQKASRSLLQVLELLSLSRDAHSNRTETTDTVSARSDDRRSDPVVSLWFLSRNDANNSLTSQPEKFADAKYPVCQALTSSRKTKV